MPKHSKILESPATAKRVSLKQKQRLHSETLYMNRNKVSKTFLDKPQIVYSFWICQFEIFTARVYERRVGFDIKFSRKNHKCIREGMINKSFRYSVNLEHCFEIFNLTCIVCEKMELKLDRRIAIFSIFSVLAQKRENFRGASLSRCLKCPIFRPFFIQTD